MAKETLNAIVGVGYAGVGYVVKHIGQGSFDGEVAPSEQFMRVPVPSRILIKGFFVQVVLVPICPVTELSCPVDPIVCSFYL